MATKHTHAGTDGTIDDRARGAALRRETDTAHYLSGAEHRFVAEYLLDFNAGRAYMTAHPGCRSKNAAYAGASRLLRRPKVQKALADEARETAVRLELTRDRIFLETARIAFFDPRKLFHSDGRPKALEDLDDDTAAAVLGVEISENPATGTVIRRYRIADKNAALERAARLLALFKEDNAQRTDPLLALLRGMNRSAFPVAPAACPAHCND